MGAKTLGTLRVYVSSIVCTLLLAAASTSVSAAQFTQLVSFGDSLSDRGNCYGTTLGSAPAGPGYSDMRFSNGAIWLETLSTKLGLGAVTRSLSAGRDFAYGGVTTGAGTTTYNPGGFIELKAPNIGKQVTDWTAANTANDNQLFTLLGGGNDFFAVLDSGSATTAQQVADNMKTNVTNLYNDGARNLLVLNLPDLGRTPRYRGTAKQAQATQLATDFNTALKTNLDDLQATKAGIHIFQLDLFAVINDVIANPGNYGLTNVTDRAYTGDDDFKGNGTVAAADPSKYLFWDAVHPTTATHTIIGNAAFALVPEPATGIVLLVGIMLAGGRKFRCAA